MSKPTFIELPGGEIVGPTGAVVARVEVDALTTGTAQEVMALLLRTLNEWARAKSDERATAGGREILRGLGIDCRKGDAA